MELLRQEIEEGRDLFDQEAEERRQQLSFADLVTGYIADQRAAGVETVDEIERSLLKDAVPPLAGRRPSEITDVEIEQVIDLVVKRCKDREKRRRDRENKRQEGDAGKSGKNPLRKRKNHPGNAMARHLLAYVRGCFNHALRGSPQLREKYGLKFNPADTVGRGRRGRPGKYGRPPVDDRFLDDEEIVRFWHALEISNADASTKRILKLLLLTGQRPSEARCTPVSELRLDVVEPVWTMPGNRTKNGEPHAVPLVPVTVALFREAVAANGGSDYVFPSTLTFDGIVGMQTLRQTVRRLCAALNEADDLNDGSLGFKEFSPKDLRTTVKTGMARLGVVKEVRDAVQNHKPQGIGDRAYNFHAYAKEKREALQLWADHVTRLIG